MNILDITVADTLVPPVRLGALLVQQRNDAGFGIKAMAERSNGAFTATDLELVEQGLVSLADDDMRLVATLYGLDLRELSSQRAMLEIDRDERRVSIGEANEPFRPGADDHEIMLRYLALVYRVRDAKPGQILPARAGDLTVLADVLGTSPEAVRSALEQMMMNSVRELEQRHSMLRRRVIVPAIGALVALTAVGGIILTNRPAIATPHRVHIGSALTIDRSSPSTSPADSAIGARIGDALVITADGSPHPGPIGPNIGDAVSIQR